MSAVSSSPLFRLPLELRNTIYLGVILSEEPQPQHPDDCLKTHYGIANPPNGNLGYKAVGYGIVDPTSRGLLGVSKQVRAEVSTLLKSLRSQNKLEYKLDLMVENVGRLLATPQCFPIVAGHIPVLRADLRFFGDYDLRRGCVAMWGYSLTSFLNTFITWGPDYVRRGGNQKPRERVSIGTLVLNILNTPTTPEWMKKTRVLLQQGEEVEGLEDSELKMRVVEREVDNLLNCRPRLIRDNHLLYERLEAVETWDKGQLRRRWVLKDLAAKWEGVDPQ